MSEWLDTQTRAILCGAPPAKFAPPTIAGYSLLLLTMGTDRGRIAHALATLRRHGAPNDTQYRYVLQKGLTLDEAMAGQFALACCDCAAVFVADEVVEAREIERPCEAHH